MARDDYFDKIIAETNKSRLEFKEKVSNYLNKVGFFAMDIERKTDVLTGKDGLKIIRAMSKENFSNVEIANMLQVSQSQFTDMKTANPIIQDAVDLGYDSRNREVENALYKIATGYHIKEKTTYLTNTGNREMKKTQINEKYIAPNERAARYWVENRRAQEYKNKANEIATSAGGFNIKVMFEEDE